MSQLSLNLLRGLVKRSIQEQATPRNTYLGYEKYICCEKKKKTIDQTYFRTASMKLTVLTKTQGKLIN